MTTVQQVYETLAALAPVSLAEKWDNVGILVDGGAPVSKILVSLDITTQVVNEAAALGCQLIVSHHPVIFSPLKTLSANDVAYHLVKRGISAICMHTNLDAAEGGVNDLLAGVFEMRDMEVFADGCGRIGAVAPVTTLTLAELAAERLGTAVKFSDAGKHITRLAVVSGSGGSFFEEARALGADCLLTGEASHHHALDAHGLGMSLVVAGHYGTEFLVVPVLAGLLQTELQTVKVHVSGVNIDPFTYL